jgi:beta-xylosidase
MVTVLAGIQYYSLIPDYLEPSLTETLNKATARYFSECQIVHYLLQMGAQKDAFSWWLMVTGTDWISDQSAKVMMWILFLLSGGLAIWGYNRYLIEIADLLIHKEKIE